MIHTEASFAKVNLFLHVTGRRSDGFHDLFSLMIKIGLADNMEFTFHEKGIQVTCNHPDVPEDETNLAHRAATLFLSSCKESGKPVPLEGVAIHINKNIPVGGGLGGGSSNAATVLKMLNARCGDLFSTEQLIEMGRCLGADVPFFIFLGPALATGTGDILERIPDLFPRYLVLCDPGVHVSTAEVFTAHDFCLTSQPKYTIKSPLNVLSWGQEIDIRHYVHNDLEGSAFKLYPEIRSTKEEMECLLKRPVAMSGSGGSLFALFADQKKAMQGYEQLCSHWGDGDKNIFLTALRNG